MDEEKFLKEHTEKNVFKQVIYKYLPFWPLFLITISISLAVAYVKLRAETRIYVATAKVLLKDPNKGAGDSKILDALNIFSEKKIVENEILVMRSSGLLGEVAKNLGLYATVYNKGRVQTEELYAQSSPVWFTTMQPETVNASAPFFFSINWKKKMIAIDKKLVSFNSTVLLNNSLFKLNINPSYNHLTNKNFFVQFNSVGGAAGGLIGSISASPISRVSTVIDVSLRTPMPAKGVAVLNNLFEIYNSNSIKDKNQIAAQTLAFIDDRLRLVINQLDSVERSIAGYKSKESVVDLGTQAGLYFGNVKELDRRESDIDLQLSILHDINNYVQNKGTVPGTVPSLSLVNDGTLASLLARLYDAEFELQKAKSIGGDQSDAVIFADESVSRIKTDILENMSNIRSGLLAVKRELNSGISENNNLLRQIPQKERVFLEISRQQAIKNNIYTFLLQKREETAVSSASTTADLRVLEPASAYGPISPIGKNYYLSALVIGVLSAAFIVLLKEIFSNKVLFRAEIEDKTKVPVIGEIIQAGGKDTIVIKDGRRTVIAEQFRSLRTNLNFLGLNENKNTLMITSSVTGEGKSFIAVNLAISFTLTGKKVALVEMDLRKPKLSKLLNVKRDPGITTLLINKATLDDIIKETAIENLCLVSAGPIPPNPTELISTEGFKLMMQQLKKRFDYVIIDTAPVAPVTDAQLTQEYADISIFIIRHAHTPRVFLNMINGLHEQQKFKTWVLFLTD